MLDPSQNPAANPSNPAGIVPRPSPETLAAAEQNDPRAIAQLQAYAQTMELGKLVDRAAQMDPAALAELQEFAKKMPGQGSMVGVPVSGKEVERRVAGLLQWGQRRQR